MAYFLKILSVVGLVLNILPALLVFNDVITFGAYEKSMLIGTLLWFATAPFWVNKKKKNSF